jgi:pimeloyl-ACP methyl ester carboxylesterase
MHPMTAYRRPRRTRAWPNLLAWASLTAAALCAGGAAWAQPVSWKEAMVCGADPQRPDARADLTQRYVITPHGTIGYYRFGQGTPIVLVTGYRATIANWNAYFLGELAKRHEVIVFDNRGIGASAPRTDAYRIEDLARDTSALMQTLRLRDVTVVGWSMGGMIVQTLLTHQPEQVRNAVLMNTAPPGPEGVPVPDPASRFRRSWRCCSRGMSANRRTAASSATCSAPPTMAR